MSGGSFNYVYRSLTLGEVQDVAKQRDDWNDLALAMAAAGFPEAAAPCAAIVARIDALNAWVLGLRTDGVDQLAKAFEWWRSNDWGEAEFRAELDRYLDGRRP